MQPVISKQVCSRLKDRLQSSESRLRAALDQAAPDHPLTSPSRELLSIHNEIRDLLLDKSKASAETALPEEGPEVAEAAIQIEREAHTLKPEFMDVLKALFMWKDDPVERAQGRTQ